MSEREPEPLHPVLASQPAATPLHPTSVPDRTTVPPPASSPSRVLPVGLGLLFGSITPEILSGSAARRLVSCTPPPPPAASSRKGPGAPALLQAEQVEVLPPPPPLRDGDRPVRAAALTGEAEWRPATAELKPGEIPPSPISRRFPAGGAASSREQRLRSVIVDPNRMGRELIGEIPQDLGKGWKEVRPRFWWRKVNPSPSGGRRAGQRQEHSRATAAEGFKGRCFRCLSPFHLVRSCSSQVHCLLGKLPGHRARSCPSKTPAASARTKSPPPLRLPLANADVSPEPQRGFWPGMARVPGHPSSRPDEEYSISICTPGMELAVSEMRHTHLGILISDPRLNISTRSIGKALQNKLDFDWADIHVTTSYPDDFLVCFEHPWQRDMALELGSVPLKHGLLAQPQTPSAVRRDDGEVFRRVARTYKNQLTTISKLAI